MTHILALLQVWISSMVLQFCGSVSKSKSSPEGLCLKQSGVCCLLKQSIFSPDKNVHPLFLWAASLFKFALFLTATPFRTIKSGNFFRYLRFQLLWNDKKKDNLCVWFKLEDKDQDLLWRNRVQISYNFPNTDFTIPSSTRGKNVPHCD